MVRVNSREGSQAIGRREFARPRERFSARGLHTHLHHAVRAFKGAAHAPCVVRIKRHGFFLIDILAGLKSGNEIQSVLMLGSGDQHRVNGLVLEQTAKIAKCLNCWREFLGFLLPARVNVSDRDGLRIWRAERVLENVHPAPARADQPEPHAVIRAENTRRKDRRTRQRGRTSRNVTNEASSIEHDATPLVKLRNTSGKAF